MRTPIDEFANHGISFRRSANSVVLERSDDSFSISEGDVLHTTMSNAKYNITVKSVVFNSTNLFQKLVVDIQGVNDKSIWPNQMVWNVPLFDTFLSYVRHELKNNCEFWIHLRQGPSVVGTSPSSKKSPSPLSPSEGFKFRKMDKGGLSVTNMHSVVFDILPGTWFISQVTFEDNQLFKSANFNKKNVSPNRTTHRTGRVEGRFERFHDNYADITLDGYFGIHSHVDHTITYESDLEFWQNLEIITHAKQFPESGEIECTSSDKVVVYDATKPYVFKKGDVFDTTVFRPPNWSGFLKQRISFDFKQNSGKDVKIYGHFHSFDPQKKTAVISIDYNKSEMVLIAVAAFAVAATAVYGLRGVETMAPGMPPTPAPASVVRGGAFGIAGYTYYTVQLDPDLPFWKNLSVTKATCKLADAKSRGQVKEVRSAVEDSRGNIGDSSLSSRQTKKDVSSSPAAPPAPSVPTNTSRKISNHQRYIQSL